MCTFDELDLFLKETPEYYCGDSNFPILEHSCLHASEPPIVHQDIKVHILAILY